MTFQTSHGQLLDLTTAPIGSVDLAKYTSDNYLRIVTFKTAYYSFYLPVACGMVLAGIEVGIAERGSSSTFLKGVGLLGEHVHSRSTTKSGLFS